MELVNAPLGKLFGKYLSASLGSAVIMTIYAFVDAIAVGQSEGPDGAAVMAVLTPVFGLFIFVALMFGIGGSVLMSKARGENDGGEANAWYSASMVLMAIVAVAIWALLLVFCRPFLILFGATEELFPLLMRYAWWLIGFSPLIIASVFLACFVRNDGAPGLAMRAVLIGGGFNILGDWFLVFPLGLGITGAALATIGSNLIQTVILCTHFFSKRCNMRFVKPMGILPRCKAICSVGFGAGMLDLANVILFCLVNNQIIRYGGVTYLAVFGAAETMSTLFQSLFSGVGQALQPIASTNFGAKESGRVRTVLKYGLVTGTVMGLICTLFGMGCPQLVVRIFMDVTPEVLAIAPGVIRPFSTIFLFMSFNVTATYYLQSVLCARQATVISLLRGIAVSGVLILLLPLLFGLGGIWYAMPLAELIVCVISAATLCSSSRTL